MIKKNLIIIPTNEKINQICDYLYQTSCVLAKENTVFIFYTNQFQPLGSLFYNLIKNRETHQSESIHYFYPTAYIPLILNKFLINPAIIDIKKINLKINLIIFNLYYFHLQKNKYRKKYLWLFFLELVWMKKHLSNQTKVIYDIVDLSTDTGHLENTIKDNLNFTNFIFANSDTLTKIYQKFTDKKITTTPMGFKSSNQSTHLLKKKGERKIIGFVGAISNRLDLNLLIKLATRNPNLEFIFVGPKVIDNKIPSQNFQDNLRKLFELKNTHHIKKQSKQRIYSFINIFDICIIPYNTNFSFNRYCYPMKLFEYFYMGKPVLSTPIRELTLPKFKNLIKIGKNYLEWESHIHYLLNKPWNKSSQRKQKQMAINNSWDNKVKFILSKITT